MQLWVLLWNCRVGGFLCDIMEILMDDGMCFFVVRRLGEREVAG